MALKKSDLYASLWASCDALRGLGCGIVVASVGSFAGGAVGMTIDGDP